jgi:hypothetical protein
MIIIISIIVLQYWHYVCVCVSGQVYNVTFIGFEYIYGNYYCHSLMQTEWSTVDVTLCSIPFPIMMVLYENISEHGLIIMVQFIM